MTRTAISAPATCARTAPAIPDYPHTFVFDNDFAALARRRADASGSDDGLLVAEGESGLCRVLVLLAAP